MGEPVRIGLLAGDSLRVLGVQTILSRDAGFEVVVHETPTPGALSGMAVVLLDGQELDGLLTRIALLVRLLPQVRLLVLGLDEDPEWMARVLDAGAKGYLLYRSTEGELLSAVRVVLEGSLWAPRRVLTRLLEQTRQRAAARLVAEVHMSPRELAVLRLLVAGQSNREIGRTLGVEEGTIKSHVSRMMARTGTRSRTALTMLALERRLL